MLCGCVHEPWCNHWNLWSPWPMPRRDMISMVSFQTLTADKLWVGPPPGWMRTLELPIVSA